MTDPAPLTEKAKEDEKSAWADVLANGISGWSSFTDTGEAVDRRVEEGEHAESAPRAAEHRSDSGAPGASDPKRGAGDKPSLARQGTSGDLSKKDGPAEAGEGDEKSGDKASKDAAGGKTKAPALDPGWKQYRRDVEWQCRWLELRMKEVGGHIQRYERMLRGIEQAKAKAAEAAAKDSEAGSKGAAPETRDDDGANDRSNETDRERSGPGSDPLVAKNVMKLRRRRDPDLRKKPPPPVLAAHPLFDEAKNRKRAAAETRGEKARQTTAQRKRARADAAAARAAREKEAKERGDASLDGLDDTGSDSDLSTAALYEQIEVLQQRVTALHARLGQPAPAMAAGGAVAATAARAAGPTGLGGRLAGQWGSGPLYGNGLPQLKRQPSRRDDFDINNVVGAAPTGAKFVERAQHVDICTPGVRPAPEYPAAGDASVAPAGAPKEDDVSSEDTSDEAYVRRHTKFEVAERTARTLPDKKDKRGGGEKPAGGGKVVAAAAEDDADSKRARTDGGAEGAEKMDAEPAAGQVDAAALVG
jgi:hypothetical protein